jgi:4-oxalomesaconate tautomerase
MVNTASVAVVTVQTPDGAVEYEGTARIDGVPGTAAPISMDFLDIAGSSCGALFPTGSVIDQVDGLSATCIDNGMPVVILQASDLDKTGAESPAELEADTVLKARIEKIRLKLGTAMNLGDVAMKTVPKMCLVSPARKGGALETRTFIPHRVHEAIGVLGAVSVATACCVPGSVAAWAARLPGVSGVRQIDIEHPTGFFTVEIDVAVEGAAVRVIRSALVRTARKLMSGYVFVPERSWSKAPS